MVSQSSNSSSSSSSSSEEKTRQQQLLEIQQQEWLAHPFTKTVINKLKAERAKLLSDAEDAAGLPQMTEMQLKTLLTRTKQIKDTLKYVEEPIN